MKTKYLFVSGGVISGIGKGITTASIALLLKQAGYSVAPIKFENYLNIDAGTINPTEHGDTFLCADGTEADMDLGTYEKFLGQPMGRLNFNTMGHIYKTVLDKERRFEYKGEDVEAIPHVTDEIKLRIKRIAKETKVDIVIVEFGGTAGEYQNQLYYEAYRMLQLEMPKHVFHIHVSYVPAPVHLGEPKTKPMQLSVKTLQGMGIQPHVLIARSEAVLDDKRKERLSLFCSVNKNLIFNNPNVSSVYQIPVILEEQDFTSKILKLVGYAVKKPNLERWTKMVDKLKAPKKKTVTIAIIGKYFTTGEHMIRDSYAALLDALDHAAVERSVNIVTKWINAEDLESAPNTIAALKKIIGEVEGIIVPIGWGVRGAEGKILAASYARKQGIPYLGLCYGMQLAAVAYARDILGIKDANTEENTPKGKHNVIHFIKTQKKLLEKKEYGGTMRLGERIDVVKKGTLVHEIYKNYNYWYNAKEGEIAERHRHRYEFNDEYAKILEDAGLVLSARSKYENLVEMIELPKKLHPFYIGTQGHPEYASTPLNPHPLFLEFVKAAAQIV
jgi:CTP synthase